ncbi:hypothetical protein CQW23_17821 [Capsicum baccatum]|uniref:Uncharacterized protein n=1 Tax=Capsicum baccatum TaxID=33114 RepID=A0A2G2WEW4_CAPBA|nr:hypothetical protein CQW23_17821 [Capsicum baccatum]
MAAVSRLQSLTNKASLRNLIRRHLLRPSAAAEHHLNISPGSQPVHFSNADNEALLNWKWNLPMGVVVFGLPVFDLSVMELRAARSTTSSKKRPVDSDDDDDDDDDYVDDDIDDVYGSSDNDDDDDYGRRGGGGRGGGAYTV